MIGTERLTITYSSNLSEVGREVATLPDHRFLYGKSWQVGKAWTKTYHPDRLQAECLMDMDLYQMSVIRVTTEAGDQYNLFLHEDYIPTVGKLYIGIIQRPESQILVHAQLGNVDDLLKRMQRPDTRGILTNKDIAHLETWSRVRLIAERRRYLAESDRSYRETHKTNIIKWETEITDNIAWLQEREIDENYDLGETTYKGILYRVIKDIIGEQASGK